MKLNGWILTALISMVGLSSSALGFTVEEAIQALKSTQTGSTAIWPELEQFQSNVWKSMALDPGPYNLVPPSLVPKELFADELTAKINQQVEALRQSPIPKKFNAQGEFEQYVSTVKKIIALRYSKQFPQSRAYGKRGILDDHYSKLMTKIYSQASTSKSMNQEAIAAIETYFQTPVGKDQKSEVQIRKSPFANGNQFIWAALIAIAGFAIGLTTVKMSPEFFERFASNRDSNRKDANDSTQVSSSTAAAATHTQNQLNYARWLREFEELLAKLKATQLTHERRIEEVFIHSQKLNQFATALCSDPRIKNESNLEIRMSNLLRELQQQMQHTHELKTGDRAQIQVTLEHCLKLCDAIEGSGVKVQQDSFESRLAG